MSLSAVIQEAPDRVFGGEVLRRAGAEVVHGVVVSVRNCFGLAGGFADVLYRGVAIEDGLQVDVGSPSQQDRFGVMIER